MAHTTAVGDDVPFRIVAPSGVNHKHDALMAFAYANDVCLNRVQMPDDDFADRTMECYLIMDLCNATCRRSVACIRCDCCHQLGSIVGCRTFDSHQIVIGMQLVLLEWQWRSDHMAHRNCPNMPMIGYNFGPYLFYMYHNGHALAHSDCHTADDDCDDDDCDDDDDDASHSNWYADCVRKHYYNYYYNLLSSCHFYSEIHGCAVVNDDKPCHCNCYNNPCY